MRETKTVDAAAMETGADKITEGAAETGADKTAESAAGTGADKTAESAAKNGAQAAAQAPDGEAGADKKKSGRKKRKTNYTLMLFADSKDGQIRQMGIGPAVVELTALFILTVVAVLAIVCWTGSRRNDELESMVAAQQKEIADLTSQNKVLTEENEDLVSLREELTDKVIVLSDTINRKVEEEEALEQEKAQAHMPVGFPMSSSASLEETGGDEPMVKLTGSEGSSIIAAADGTVVSVTTDSAYLHCIKIDHENGYNTIYRNDGDVMIKEGDTVVKGAILYVIGEDNTELGYQITYDGKYIDPMELINIDG